jgi:hypothetical protein
MLLAVVTIVFAPLAHIFAIRPGSLFAKGWRVNLGWYFFNGLFTALLLELPALLIAWLIHSGLPGSVTEAAAGLPAMGAHGRGHDRGRNWLLLGSSMEPRNSRPLAISRRSSQR